MSDSPPAQDVGQPQEPGEPEHELEEEVISSDPAPEQPPKEKPSLASPGNSETEEQQSDPTAEASHSPAAPAPSNHVFNEHWSQLPKEEVVDKIKGVIYGQAIGDALGLATEFMSRKMAQKVYGKAGPSGYEQIAQDFHRMRWTPGDWTDDTDQMLLILQSVVENNGRVDRLDFARRILHWMKHGFQELGDYGGMGIGMTVSRTLNHYLFLSDPHAAANHVWESSGRYLAANGAIMRTALLGILNFNDLPKVVENTQEISKTTHADPRCTASCIAVTTAIALMLQGKFDPMKDRDLHSLVDEALKCASEVLILKPQKKEIREHVQASSLGKLKLDEEACIGYTFKALGAGFYGLRRAKDFRETIQEVIMEAGDADSNGAVCGALMGCKFGFKALPDDLLQFPHRQWLDDQVEKFLKTIGLQE